MTSGHVVAFGLALTGIATQMQGLHSWNEVLSVQFVAGAIMAVAGVLVASASKQLNRDPTSNERSYDRRA